MKNKKKEGNGVKKTISTFITLWIVWLLLAGFSLFELIAGAVASLILAVVINKFVDISFGPSSILGIIKFIVIYIPVFIWKLILANIDVAYRVLSPKMPINPGMVKVKTSIDKPVGKLVLANSITLTPGTLSVDVKDEDIYVHWINVNGDKKEYGKKVAGEFESILGGIFR